MAFFGKKSLDSFSLEELEAEIAKRKQVEDNASEMKTDTEPVAPEAVETEEVEETENVESMEEEKTEEVETMEDVEAEKEQIDANAEVIEALQAKLEAGLEEMRAYGEKVDALLKRVGDIDTPADEVGLEKTNKIESEKNEDEMSAFEFAQKHKKY